VDRRIQLIQADPRIRILEQPEYKRRWSAEPWENQVEKALRSWLVDRLESYFDFDGRMNEQAKPTARVDKGLISIARLADIARLDEKFLEVGEVYRTHGEFDVARLVAELVESESVPLLPVLRYTAVGLEKRKAWERTWELQRLEDKIDERTKLPKEHPDYLIEADAIQRKRQEVGEIPVPPKYTTADFRDQSLWRLRGKLDVPKERWVSFPHCEGPERSVVVAWAGYDHLELARAISAYYVEIQEKTGGREDPRLVPLLACLLELLPWLKQWHNDLDPEFGMRMGDYFEGFVQEESRSLQRSLPDIAAWQPPDCRVPKRTRKKSGGGS
jgi:hypothetical protein